MLIFGASSLLIFVIITSNSECLHITLLLVLIFVSLTDEDDELKRYELLQMVALLLISIGTVIKAMYEDFEYFLESSYYSPSNLLIFCGFVIFFIAFFGCWGAMRESTLLVNIVSWFS